MTKVHGRPAVFRVDDDAVTRSHLFGSQAEAVGRGEQGCRSAGGEFEGFSSRWQDQRAERLSSVGRFVSTISPRRDPPKGLGLSLGTGL
ncbi:hypothetical protein [Stieleria mannarensis]|uniref:hypothetical protein n=1 Tax=Stieleria mannarensis TaxID=2755585 RepID=UPI001C71EBE3|nr:hypothetical protein [Rhodopirellula sp. JC639]